MRGNDVQRVPRRIIHGVISNCASEYHRGLDSQQIKQIKQMAEHPLNRLNLL